jgi:uncharacterized membrane protein
MMDDEHPKAHTTRRPSFLSMWNGHPAVTPKDQLTRGERAADVMRNGMGSWGFVFGALIFLAVWMAYNRNSGFDKYPFILLNLVLSCLAAMQGAILLIAAKRSDQIASQLAQHDYQTNVSAASQIGDIHGRLIKVQESNRELLERNSELLARNSALLEQLTKHFDGSIG